METTSSGVFIQAEDCALVTVGEGVQRRILGYGPDLMMTYVTFKKGAVGTIHSHPHRQVSYIESGSFEVQIGGERQVLKAGDSYIVPSDVAHGAVALEDGVLVDVFAPARIEFLDAKD